MTKDTRASVPQPLNGQTQPIEQAWAWTDGGGQLWQARGQLWLNSRATAVPPLPGRWPPGATAIICFAVSMLLWGGIIALLGLWAAS